MKNNQSTLFYIKGKIIPKVSLIPCEDQIVEKDKDGMLKERSIRYVPGEPSIYKDEQPETAARRARSISIRQGAKIVHGMEISLLEYLRKCNYNGSNPNRKGSSSIIFHENVPGEKSKEFLEKDASRVEIQYNIHKMSASDLEVLAYNIGIKQANTKMSEDLKRDCLVMCTNKPHLYEDVMKDFDRAKVKHTIMLGTELGDVVINNNRVIIKGGKQVFECDFGLDVVSEFTTYCMSNSGKNVYGAICKLVKPFEKIEVLDIDLSEEMEDDAKPKDTAPSMSSEDLFEKGLESGVINKSGRAYFYTTTNGEEELLGSNKSFAIKEISNNLEVFKYIESKL